MDAPGGRDQQAEQHGDGGGLAGAVAAEQPHGAADGHGEVDVVHRERRVVALGQALDPDRVHAARLGAASGNGKPERARSPP